jgi:hypothetical protein
VTSVTDYQCGDAGPAGLRSFREALVVAGGCYQIAIEIPVDGGVDAVTAAGEISIQNGMVTTTQVCPVAKPAANPTAYTVMGNTITTLVNGQLNVLTKQ